MGPTTITWQEDIYKFKVLKIEKPGLVRGFERDYRLRAYGENGQPLDHVFGNLKNLTEARKTARELMAKIPHTCTLEKGVEVITETTYSVSRGYTQEGLRELRRMKKNFR